MIFIQFFCQLSLCSVAVKTATLTMCVKQQSSVSQSQPLPVCACLFSCHESQQAALPAEESSVRGGTDRDARAAVVRRSLCVCPPLMSCLVAFLFVYTLIHSLLLGVRQMASRHATSREAQRRATSWSFFLPKATDTD